VGIRPGFSAERASGRQQLSLSTGREMDRESSRVSRLVGLLAAALGVVYLLADPVLATEQDMAQLPLTTPFECLTCHVVRHPDSGSHALNPFGEDFLQNGRIWDSNLAHIDSDGDNCLNGVEIGDSDGDGFADGNVEEQAGNPGVQDNCGSGSLVDEKTWGALKAMFDGR